MNSQGLLLIHKFAYGTKITPQNFEAIKLANTLFEDCLDKEEKDRMWNLLIEQSNEEHIKNYISNSTPVTEELTIKQRRPEVKWQTKISNPDNLIIQEVELQSGRQLTKKANLS